MHTINHSSWSVYYVAVEYLGSWKETSKRGYKITILCGPECKLIKKHVHKWVWVQICVLKQLAKWEVEN